MLLPIEIPVVGSVPVWAAVIVCIILELFVNKFSMQEVLPFFRSAFEGKLMLNTLAVMIFGQWKPTRIALAALLFGFCRALGNVYSGFDFLKALNLPAATYNMLPYIISLVVLAFTSKKSRAPKAEGVPYDKGQR